MESMMLSQDASELDRMEKEEILSYLPAIDGKTVLELGSGIGRFTDHLAPRTAQLTTVDFMTDYVERNRQRNGHHSNVDFLRADVTQLDFPETTKFDCIFSNWLLMYLSDDEIKSLTRNMLRWLKEDGFLFIRESCFHPSGNIKKGDNPTFYRSPSEYFHLLQKEIASSSVFELQRANSVHAYVKEFCKKLDLQAGQSVLDVGCGIGGSAFFMAAEYDVQVRGVDLSTNMITLALENQAKLDEPTKKKICLEIRDITKATYPDESFDVIYSRDTLLHIGDKETLFANFYKWLKPGGRVLISDYCRGDQQHSERFLKYVAQRGYHLLTVNDYGAILSKVGFQNVDAQDVTPYFVEILHKEMAYFSPQKEEFIKEFSAEDFSDIMTGWQDKVEREENVWHLCRLVKEKHKANLSECFCVFISNSKRSIPLWHQKAGQANRQGLVVWDYHVIFIQKTESSCHVYDLDSCLSFPCLFEEYSRKTIRDDDLLQPDLQRFFRVVPAEDFINEFASDRSHMRAKDGNWLKTPPNYPPICTLKSVNNLDQYINMQLDVVNQQFALSVDHFFKTFYLIIAMLVRRIIV
nr:EOG090X0C0Q [Eubosmina coregoni]